MEAIHGRVTKVTHTTGEITISYGDFTASFNFIGNYRECTVIGAEKLTISTLPDTFPRVGDNIVYFRSGQQLLGWCYEEEFRLAKFKFTRSQPVREMKLARSPVKRLPKP